MLKSISLTSKNRSRSSIIKFKQNIPEIHPWYKLWPNEINSCEVIVFTSEIFYQPPWPRKIGQGHPSSNLTKTLLRYIHGISLGPMWLKFVELLCLQAKCWRTDRRTDGQTDGHANLIVGLVTGNLHKNKKINVGNRSSIKKPWRKHSMKKNCLNFSKNKIKGPWASIGPLSFCFIEVMHNEFGKFLSSILSFLTFEKLHAEIFGQHFNTTNQ